MGGLAHLLFQTGDLGVTLGAGHLDVALADGGGILGGDLDQIPDVLADRLRNDAVRLVVGVLNAAAAIGFADRVVHRGRHLVGIHDHAALSVSGGASDRLDQAGRTAEEALLVGVQNGDQRDLGQIQTLAQQIDADQNVKLRHAQVADDLHPLQRPDIRVHIADADAVFLQKGGQILCHLFGQGGDEDALLPGCDLCDLAHEVVHLILDGPDLDLGVEQTRGADDLLHDLPRPLQLIGRGRGGDADDLMDLGGEFVKGQGPVVKGGGQAEAVVHEGRLAGAVAVVHGSDLGQGDVAFVHKQQEILREIVQQGHRRGAGGAPGHHAGVVFDAGAEADLLEHLHIVLGALSDALSLQKPVVLLEELLPLLHLLPDVHEGPLHFFGRRDVVGGRINCHVGDGALRDACDGVDLGNAVDLVAEKLNSNGPSGPVGRVDLHGVAADAEVVAHKLHVVALVADRDQLFQQLLLGVFHTGAEGDDHAFIVDGVSEPVDAGDRGHHDHVPALKERGGGAVAQTLDLVVDRRVLFDIGIRVRDIGLRLIVVVIGDEILHGVLREELPKFRTELGSQSLVVRQNEGGTVEIGDHVRHREGLAGAGDAEQDLFLQPHLDPARQGLDGLRLVAGGAKRRMQLEIHGDASFSDGLRSIILQRAKRGKRFFWLPALSRQAFFPWAGTIGAKRRKEWNA